MPFIETRDGTNLYYKDWGTGRPVLLLHGWPLSSDSWDDVALPLAEAGFRAIAYDRRGFGRSDQPWDGYTYDTLADDLADVMEAVGAQDAALVGFSMGGGEVARYMSRHGGRNVRQAALIASVVPYMLKTDDNPDGTPQSVFDGMAEGMKKDRAHFFASFFKTFYGTTLLQGAGLRSGVSAEMVEWSRDTAMKASLKATLDCATAFATTDFRPDLPHFRVPTLIIHGTADETVPIDAAGRAAARGIAGSTLIEYEGAPHGLFASDKERLIGDLLTFLRS
ncbi:alpha/beta fold hydrolase [Falsirhodobacter sp. 20TX0035]|uniref:alpha/beta fold hydrolase n=1 Tax=Falsirhodobacter sp. 20TX0035 TaxID=3022019 RepID=UPI00232E9D4F|nr:alpha/beta hydrolase [Falsirhodobacter sp. 20TX0035]MDB6453447.1 alpha/beta hydrolase [Falsirhodobacter sp. 20TX0035]